VLLRCEEDFWWSDIRTVLLNSPPVLGPYCKTVHHFVNSDTLHERKLVDFQSSATLIHPIRKRIFE
jgi:hypothetical protein